MIIRPNPHNTFTGIHLQPCWSGAPTGHERWIAVTRSLPPRGKLFPWSGRQHR